MTIIVKFKKFKRIIKSFCFCFTIELHLCDGSTPGLAGVVSSSDLVLVLADHKHPAWITKYQSLVPERSGQPRT